MKRMGILSVAALVAGLAACGDTVEDQGSLPAVTETAPAVDLGAMTETETGLRYQDLEVGTGEEAVNGMSVSVHYTGWFLDGEKFDSSVDRGEPYGLTLPGPVIPGWNEGIPGMRVGGMRRLVRFPRTPPWSSM
jgi:FKBP-type peptidyl-prolyl cis-trans isomerase